MVETITSANAEPAYRVVRRPARDHLPGRGVALASLAPVFEDIPGTPHGVKEFFFEGVVNLRTKASHVDIDHVRLAVEIHIPNLLGYQDPPEYFSRASRQEREQEEFLGSEINAATAPGDLMRSDIDFQVGDSKLVRMSGRRSAQNRLDPRQEFGERERLYEVVVSPQDKSLDTVRDCVPGGQEEHGGILACLPEITDDGPAVAARQHDVQNDEIIISRIGEMRSLLTIGGDVDDKAALPEALLQVGCCLVLVFNDQKLHRPTTSTGFHNRIKSVRGVTPHEYFESFCNRFQQIPCANRDF